MEKAVVALVMSVLEIVNLVWGENIFSHLTQESIGVIIAALIPVAVWLFPNTSWRFYGIYTQPTITTRRDIDAVTEELDPDRPRRNNP